MFEALGRLLLRFKVNQRMAQPDLNRPPPCEGFFLEFGALGELFFRTIKP